MEREKIADRDERKISTDVAGARTNKNSWVNQTDIPIDTNRWM